MKIIIDVLALKTARVTKGYTQEHLAKCCNISRFSIAHMETRRTIPRITNLKKICDALNLDMQAICKVVE